jgi:hypothetical protein
MDCDVEILPEIRASRSTSPGALIIDDSIEESCADNDSTEIHENNRQASIISKSVSSPPAICTLCGMQVTCMNIHWRLNHRKVRMQLGAAKFGLGFQIGGGSDSPLSSSIPVRKIRKRKKKVSATAINTPAGFKRTRVMSSPPRVEVCREPDPLELYPGGGSAEDHRTFSLQNLSPSAQKSAVQSLAFLTQLGGSILNFFSLMGFRFFDLSLRTSVPDP